MDPGVVPLFLVAALVAFAVGVLARPRSPAPTARIAEPEPVEVAPIPGDSEDRPDTALVPVGRGGERWVPLLAAVAPVAALGAWFHHRRFVSYHQRRGAPPTTTFQRWVAAETVGLGRLSLWHVQGFLRDGLRVPANRSGRTVLCIHGYAQNATNFHGLRRVLESLGRPTVAVSLGYRLAPMSWYARALERALERLVVDHPDGIDLVAHSMGGVVLRMVLARRPDLRAPLRTVVTLGSPHRGTAAARGIPWVPEIRALGRRSGLLADLPQLPALLPQARVVTVAGDADTIVYPLESALVTGAQKVVLPGIGHAGLLTDQAAWDAVVRALGEPHP